MCYEDVKDLVEKLREEKEGKIIPEDPLQYGIFLTLIWFNFFVTELY